MAGRNVFHETRNFSKAAASSGVCVFVSHRKADVTEARELVQAILAAEFDVYFDGDDECLAGASEDADPLRVVDCIDEGLARCSHLLGLITARTRGSWWVPYEIGASRAKGRPCAFLIHPDVELIPAYVQAATVLPDREKLKTWLPSLSKSASSVTNFSLTLRKAAAFYSFPTFIPGKRTTPLRFG